MTTATFPPVPPLATNDVQQINRIVEAVNRINRGGVNVTNTVTLTENTTTTTLSDPRLSAQSFIGLMPTTANAAGALATTYVSARAKGTATLMHANNAQTDRTFTVLIIG